MTAVRSTLLIDEVLPEFDVRTRHSRHVAASPESVWRAVERYDLSRDGSLPVRALFRLRGLPAPRGSSREMLAGFGFVVLAERPGEEIVAGITGRFWVLRERGNLERPADLEAFKAFHRPGWAKGVMSIGVEPLDDGSTNLVTETRVQCLDRRARLRFALYWTLIDVFSGWIRRDMLRAMARSAEGAP
jgi:hypothetical protein